MVQMLIENYTRKDIKHKKIPFTLISEIKIIDNQLIIVYSKGEIKYKKIILEIDPTYIATTSMDS